MPTESHTRQSIIDQRLLEAGWNINDLTQVVQEDKVNVAEEPALAYHSANPKSTFADYVLLGKDGKAIAVIEAKKSSVDPAIGREQAKQYCHNLQQTRGGDLPFCFYTNGHDIWFWDLGNYPPQKVYGFPTRDDLERYQALRRSRKPLAEELINQSVAGRDYQQRAIRAVLEGIDKKRRKFLLVMATGTGKTRTCIALVDALMRAGWVERTLFLVDRIALRTQALDAFKEHLPNEPRWPKDDETTFAANRRVYVSTYPTMLNVVKNPKHRLSPHFFDLIVVDESHRSIYNTYKEIIDYFHTITLGLTATPTDVIDHNTFQLFECEDGLPSFAYTYDEAVNHIPPYLSNFQVLKFKTKFQDDGISKRTIALEDQKQLILEGKEVEEINFEGTELEKSVTNKGTNTLIVREFMEECIKDANGVLPGKTIFFCISKKHARRVEEIFDSLYPEYNGELAKVILSDDPRVHGKSGLLEQFKSNDMPRIAISVDMLDTGIDVLEITNLVFAKPVFSYTKFWQMIGRGTRLLNANKIKPWCTQKDIFLVIDCWDNFEYFKINPKGKSLPVQIPLPVRLFGLRLEKIEAAREKGDAAIVTKETERLRVQIAGLPAQSVVIMDAGVDLAVIQPDNWWALLTDSKIEFLRNRIKPLLRTAAGADFKAMRFEKDILEASLAHLREEKEKFDTLKEGIIAEIAELPLTVNIVAAEEQLIRKSQTNHFWSTINEEKLDLLAERLAPLMRYRDTNGPGERQVAFNLKDVLVSKEFIEFGPQHESIGIARYREMVEQKIQDLLTMNPLLQKVRGGVPLNEQEAEILAQQLHDEHPHITLDLLRRVYNHRQARFLQFIRHILGLEILESFPDTVSKAFEQFIAEHGNLSSRQLQFLVLLQDFITEKGRLEKKDLIESPFTMIHPQGIRGIFAPREIEEILEIAKRLLAA